MFVVQSLPFSLSAVQPVHPQVVQQILSYLSLMNVHKLCVKFIWAPSCVGLRYNATTDCLTKDACRLPPRGDERLLSLLCYLYRVPSAAFLPTRRRRDAERPHSVTINHYESVCRHKYSCRRRGLVVRRQCYFRTSAAGLPSPVAGRRGGGEPVCTDVACAAHRCQTPSNTAAWPAPLSVACCPKDSRWVSPAATSYTVTYWMSSWCAAHVLVDSRNVTCPPRRL